MSGFHAIILRFCLITILLLAGCRQGSVAVLPTVVVLPSITASPTDSPLSTATETPPSTFTSTLTETPDAVATNRMQLHLTNVAGEQTLNALWTSMAPTQTPTLTYTPSLTITMTLTPLPTPTPSPEVQAIRAAIYYARSTANLRACADRSCETVAQLQYGAPIQVNGRINGEAVNGGNRVWYRVVYDGDPAFVYSELVALTLPTAVPPTQPPIYVMPISTIPPMYNPPVYSPPVDSAGGCPSLSATCSQLSCPEAQACLRAGNRRLDRDHDGIACDSDCE